MLDPGRIGRLGELNGPPPRTERVRQVHDKWYFTTREGKIAGPFHTQYEAGTAVEDFVRFAVFYSEEVLLKLLDHMSEAAREIA